MSNNQCTTKVIYRELGFIGFPKYKVGTDGSLWTCRRRALDSSGTIYEVAEKIRNEFSLGGVTIKQLAIKYNSTYQTASRIIRGKRWADIPWTRKNPTKNEKGYLYATLTNGEVSKHFFIHTLVLLAFVGPQPDGMEACHYPDRDRCNNNVGNLRWDTHVNNIADKIEHGTYVCGEDVVFAKLTEVQVLEIRRLFSSGEVTNKAELGRRYGVSQPNIFWIIVRRNWKHI